jgi:CDGSH-type Zn-finger protein
MDEADTVTVTPYRDGPLILRGPFRILDQDGVEIANERATVALCRCGLSARKPFCDGSHSVSGFRAPSGREAAPESAPPVS